MLADLSPGFLFLLALFAVMGTLVVGVLTNAILRDLGFGAFVNGVLVLVGSLLGVWVRLVLMPGA